MKDKKVMRSGQHEFTKGKSCLTSLINFYDEMAGLIDKGRVVDIVYKSLSSVRLLLFSPEDLTEELIKYGLHEHA